MTYLIDRETEDERAERDLQVLNQSEDNNDIANATRSLELANDRARQILGLMWLKAVEAKDEETQAALIALDEQYTANSVTTANVILLLNAARQTLSTIRDQRDAARAEHEMLENDMQEIAQDMADEQVAYLLADTDWLEEQDIEDWANRISEDGDIATYDAIVDEMKDKWKRAKELAEWYAEKQTPTHLLPEDFEDDDDDAA